MHYKDSATVTMTTYAKYYSKQFFSTIIMVYTITRNKCTQEVLARFTGFSFAKYPRERFENANIWISPTFQETVGSHLKPSLPVVVTATLNQFNSNLFVFSKQ